MSLVPATALALLVLAAAGCLPVLGLVGFRWFALPLIPLGGAVVAAVAATCGLGIGADTMTWFVIVAVLGALSPLGFWWWRPDRRPWAPSLQAGSPAAASGAAGPGHRAIGIVGLLGVFGACAWCLRTLATPTIGFDTRAIWLLRAGWFLQPHHQLLVDMSTPGVFLPQTAYPPLVSAVGSVAYAVSGNHALRLGVVVIAVLNACALAAAALAVVEAGRRASGRLGPTRLAVIPSVVGLMAALALVFVTFAITEPFMTNGYADPIWALSAVGAIAFGLQMGGDRSNIGAAAILLLVAGMAKDEGAATAAILIGLVALRRLMAVGRAGRRGWWKPVAAALLGWAFVGAWPATIHLLHLRDAQNGGGRRSQYLHRAHQTFTGTAPYLHVVILAAAVAVAGWLVLIPLRRATGMGNDLWGWAGLASGTAVLLAAYVTGTLNVPLWLTTTAHRVTEFTALSSWWLIALWAVTGSAGPAYRWCRSTTGPAVVQGAGSTS